jgi:hypothetical protein
LTPFCQFRKNIGVVWKLPLRETSRLLATSRMVKPPPAAFVRSTATLNTGNRSLLYAQVDEARHLAKLSQDPVRQLAVALDVRALELNVDRRRQAEVQDLGDDIRRHEVKRGPGERARQGLAQLPDIVGRGTVIGLESDQYVGVACADGAGRVAYEIERGIGSPMLSRMLSISSCGSPGEWRPRRGRSVAPCPRCACRSSPARGA